MKTSPGYKKEAESKDDAIHEDFEKTDETVNIRKIKNGFIVKTDWREKPKGKDGMSEYKSEEVYHEKNPVG